METYPFECYFASWLHGHESPVALGQLVAHDINTAKAIGRNEAIVEVVGLPAHSCWDRGLIFQGGVPALVSHAIGNDLVDVPMGKSESR
jgi:hypothetical protein